MGNTFDRLVVGPTRTEREQFLRQGWEALTLRHHSNLLPWPLPDQSAFLDRCDAEPAGRHEWLSGPSTNRIEWRSALAVVWWHDFIGRLHFRIRGKRATSTALRKLRSLGPAQPRLWPGSIPDAL